ncbi:TetR/AcrR family transcriptional regulator [uncultured Jatrophihabitans sp.]|uniref:TetR/AcrR family transcriptional regulator n=1 Tax=uncultured Jatrophihabitans sp. TaxID=1610747 RepID=UPI0035CA5947
MPSSRPYRGVSGDERHEQRRRLLVEAALDCLHDEGLAGVSVRSVCARARLTPRYFYECFADLDDLLSTAVSTVTDEVATCAVTAARRAPDGTEAQVRAAIDAGYGVVAKDPRKATAMLVAGAGHEPLREHRHDLVSAFADLIIDSISVLNALGLAERRRARATALFVMGGSADVIEAVLSGRLRMSRSTLVDELTALWLGALGALTTAQPGTDRAVRG